MMSRKQKIIWKDGKMNLRNFLFFTIFSLVVAMDQITKAIIRKTLEIGSSKIVIPNIFSLTHLRNTGVAFGLFKGSNTLFIIISFLVLIFFLFVYFKNGLFEVQIAIICAGIVGNLIDRIFFGSVIDFFNFHIWPVFNIADSAISIGIILLIIVSMRTGKDLF